MMSENKFTAIIDLDSVMFVIGLGNKVLDSEGNPTKDEKGRFIYTDKTEEEMKASADWIMNDILTSCKADNYIAYIKGSYTTSERVRINPEYKANRPKESPWWWAFCKQYLMEKYKAFPVNGYEVDDYVSITKRLVPESFICAIDKDLLGLEGRHYNWRTRKWFEVTKELAEYNFWASMIIGDTADNIKGIPGKGEKYAERLLNQPKMSGYAGLTFQAYIGCLGVDVGIKQFYQNYFSLKILDKLDGFVVPKKISYPELKEIEDGR